MQLYSPTFRTLDEAAADFRQFGGRCHELASAAAAADPTLRLVRGHYYCPVWGERAHWWCVKPDDTIVDPSVLQFPTAGFGATYVEFDGNVDCDQCGKTLKEEDATIADNGHYAFCNSLCYGRFVGVS